MKEWKDALKLHKETVLNDFDEKQIFGIFTYGSQNYNLASENSDWDTIAVVIPTFKDLVFRKSYSENIVLDNGEHIVINDIYTFILNLKKQNINFIETLFTDYKWINPIYKGHWAILSLNKENIGRYDEFRTIYSVLCQAKHTLKQNPEDEKKVANAIRFYRFVEMYEAGFSYKDCITLTDAEKEVLLQIKLDKNKGKVDVNKIANELLRKEMKIINKKGDYYSDKDLTFRTKLDMLFENFIMDIIQFNLILVVKEKKCVDLS